MRDVSAWSGARLESWSLAAREVDVRQPERQQAAVRPGSQKRLGGATETETQRQDRVDQCLLAMEKKCQS